MVRLFYDQKWIYRILRHALLFLSMVFLFAWAYTSRAGPDTVGWQVLLMVLNNAVFFFAYAYLSVYVLIPMLLAHRRYTLFILGFILAGLALSGLKFLSSEVVFYQVLSPEDTSPMRVFSMRALLVNTKDMTFIVALFAMVKYARDHYVLAANIRELQQKGLEAEIKLLEHQMDPHVIFNNFNNLYSISISRPALLRETVRKLKAILHYLFHESKQEKVLLSEELKMIENYIGLEQLRYGDRLKSSYRLEGNVRGLKIPPLILYPFVENCFVHGAGEDPLCSWIRIRVIVGEGNLRFCASNSVSEQLMRTGAPGKNGGIENSIRRLEIQYPNSHRLAIRDRPHEHRVELNIRLE